MQSLERASFNLVTSVPRYLVTSSLKSLSLGHNFPYFTVGFLDLHIYECPWGRIHVKKNKSIGTNALIWNSVELFASLEAIQDT